MCGKGIHRAEVIDDKRYCYMDYYCTADFCKCAHIDGCDCEPEPHNCDPDEDGFCYGCTYLI